VEIGGRDVEVGVCVEGTSLACTGAGVDGKGEADGSGLTCSGVDIKDC
jgi:hypothetical protein